MRSDHGFRLDYFFFFSNLFLNGFCAITKVYKLLEFKIGSTSAVLLQLLLFNSRMGVEGVMCFLSEICGRITINLHILNILDRYDEIL